MTSTLSLSVAAILAAAAGCASMTSGQRAQTLGRGRYEVGVETSYRATLERDSVLGFPMLGVAGRIGVTDRFDAGVRISSAGLGVQGKLRLAEAGRTVISIAPSVDWVHAYDQGVGFDTVETALPALVSYELRPDLQLLASPRVHSSFAQIEFGDHYYLHTLGVGTGVGVAFEAGRSWVIPELGVLWPFLVTGEPPDEMGGTTTRLGRVIAQVSITVVLGSK